jgi:uncharacterized protein YndB with AHSA1/START domain
MPDVLHDLPIKASRDRVFQAVSTPDGLDAWWTKRASGTPAVGQAYELGFGPEYDWRGEVTRCVPDVEFELRITRADADWTGTLVGFSLDDRALTTWLHFHHAGWASPNEHYRVSCNCWALYLRLLRRYVERGERVPYENRLDA